MPPKRKFTGEISRNFIKNDYRRGASRHGKRNLRGDSALRLGKRLRNGQLKVTKFQTRAQKAKTYAREKNEGLYSDLLDEEDLEGVVIDDAALSSSEEELRAQTVAAASTSVSAPVPGKRQIMSSSTRTAKAAKDMLGLNKVFSPGAVAGGVGFGHTRTRQLHLDYLAQETIDAHTCAPGSSRKAGGDAIGQGTVTSLHLGAAVLGRGASTEHGGVGDGGGDCDDEGDGACGSDALDMSDHDLDISDSDGDGDDVGSDHFVGVDVVDGGCDGGEGECECGAGAVPDNNGNDCDGAIDLAYNYTTSCDGGGRGCGTPVPGTAGIAGTAEGDGSGDSGGDVSDGDHGDGSDSGGSGDDSDGTGSDEEGSSGTGSSDDDDAFELVLVDESTSRPPSPAAPRAGTCAIAIATPSSAATASRQAAVATATGVTAASTRIAAGASTRSLRSRPRPSLPRTSAASSSLSVPPARHTISSTDTTFPAPSPTALLDDPVLHLPPHLHTRATLLHILRHHFGHRDFNPGQQEAISAILRGESSLLVLPTGCGKSLCYIFAAYVLKHCRYCDTDEGAPPQWRQAHAQAPKTGLFLPNFANLCVVVSPLVSLMQDQLVKLPPHVHGAAWTADATPKQTELLLNNIAQGHIDILFVSPERLAAPACQVKLLRALTTYQRQREQLFGVGEGRAWTSGAGLPCYDSRGVSLACVDEAHCVSEWSHAFRHDYLRLSRLLTDFLRAPVILALTATASTYTQHDVCKLLHIPLQNVYRCAALRHNLFLACVYSANKLHDLLTVLRSSLFVSMNPNLDRRRAEQPPDAVTYGAGGRAGGKQARYKNDPRYRSVIVYAHTQYACDHLQLALKSEDIRCAAYHAGIDSNERHRTQQQFLRNEVDVIVATIAFGMGLDKSNVGAVVHYTVAPTVENMVQEVGRAGRDGRASYCVALYNDTDVTRHLSHAHSDGMDRGAVEGVFSAVFEEAEKRGGVELARAASEEELAGGDGTGPQRPSLSADGSAANPTATAADGAFTEDVCEAAASPVGGSAGVSTTGLSLSPAHPAPLSHAARLQRSLDARTARVAAGAGVSGGGGGDGGGMGAGADARDEDHDLDLLPAARRKGKGSVGGKAGAKRRKCDASLVTKAGRGTSSEASDSDDGVVEDNSASEAGESDASDADDVDQRVGRSTATSSTSTRKSAASRPNGLTHPSLVNPARSRARVYVPVDVRALASSLGLTEPMVNTVLAQGLLLSAAHCELFRAKIDVARQRGVEVRETVMAVAVEKLGQARGAGYYDMVSNAHNVAKLGFLRGSPLALLWEHVSVMAAMVQCGCVEVVTEEAWNKWREDATPHAEDASPAGAAGLPSVGATIADMGTGAAASAHVALDDAYEGNKLNNPYYAQKLSQASRSGARDPRRVYRYFLPNKYRAMVEDEQAQCGVWARETVYFRFKARSSGIYPLDLCQACNDTQLPMAVLQKDLAYLRAHRKITVAWDQPATVLRVTARPSSTALLTDIVHYKLERHERFAAQKVRIAALALQLASVHPLLSHPHAPLPVSAEQVCGLMTSDDSQPVGSRGGKNNNDPLPSPSVFSQALAALRQPATGAVPATMQGMRGVSAALAQLQLQQLAWDAHARCSKEDASSSSSSSSAASLSPLATADFLSPLVSGIARASLPWYGSLLHVLMAEYLSSPQPHLLEEKLKGALEACRKCGRSAARVRMRSQPSEGANCASSDSVGVSVAGTCKCGYAVDADVLESYGNVGGRGEIMDGVFAYRIADSEAGQDDVDVAAVTTTAAIRRGAARVDRRRASALPRDRVVSVREGGAAGECVGLSSDRGIGHGSSAVPDTRATGAEKPHSAKPAPLVQDVTDCSGGRAVADALVPLGGAAAATTSASYPSARTTTGTTIDANGSPHGNGGVASAPSPPLYPHPHSAVTSSPSLTPTSAPPAATTTSRPPRIFALPTLPHNAAAAMPPTQYAILRVQLQGLVRSHADSGDGALGALAMELPRALARRLQACYEALKQCDRDAAALTRDAMAVADLPSVAASPATTSSPTDTCALPTAADPASASPSSSGASSAARAGSPVDIVAASSASASTPATATPASLYQRKYAILFPFLDLSFGGLSPRLLARLCHALPSPTLPSAVWRNHALWGAWQTTSFDCVRVCACEAIVRVAWEERQWAEQWEKEQSRKRAEMRRNAKKRQVSEANSPSGSAAAAAAVSGHEDLSCSLSASTAGSLAAADAFTPYSAATVMRAGVPTSVTVSTAFGAAAGAFTSGATVTPADARAAAAAAAEAAIARCSAVTPTITTTAPPPRRRPLASTSCTALQRPTAPAVGVRTSGSVATAAGATGVGSLIVKVHAGASADTAAEAGASAAAGTLRARLGTQYGVGTSLGAVSTTSTRPPALLSSARSVGGGMRAAARSTGAGDVDAVDPALLALLRDKNL